MLSQIALESVSTVASDFLDAKISTLEDERSYIACVKDGLFDIKTAGLMSSEDYQGQIQPVLHKMRTASHTLTVLKRQRRFIEEDLDEEVKYMRMDEPEDGGLVERAYANTIMARVMSAAAKIRRQPFDQRAFKKAVIKYYSLPAKREPPESCCHILGFSVVASSVKAAHIVPKSLNDAELSHLFGAETNARSDPQNCECMFLISEKNKLTLFLALSLLNSVESLFDQGTIAVIPTPGPLTSPTTWQCIVLDESKFEQFVWKDSDGKSIKVKVSFIHLFSDLQSKS